MLLPRYYLTHFEFTDFCFLLPEFYCRSLNPAEAVEGRRNHGPLRGLKMLVSNKRG